MFLAKDSKNFYSTIGKYKSIYRNHEEFSYTGCYKYHKCKGSSFEFYNVLEQYHKFSKQLPHFLIELSNVRVFLAQWFFVVFFLYQD